MKPTLIKEAIKKTMEAGRPAFVWGAAGVGKSEVIAQIADEMFGAKHGLEIDENGRLREKKSKKFTNHRPYFVDLRLLLLDPVDLRGLPRLNGDNLAHWCPPDFLPKDGEGILFLDELNAATPLVQASAYQLVLNRKVGEYELPEGWHIIAAGNRETDRAITHRMPSPLANRFVHLEFEIDPEDWIAWALRNAVRTEVISFIRMRYNLLHQFDPKRNDKAFPTPRTWVFVSQLMDTKPSGTVELSLLQGTVGEGAGAEFKAFIDLIGKMPSIDMILLNPENVSVPKEPAILYALSTALGRVTSSQNVDNVCTYLKKMPKEFQVLTIKDATKQHEELFETRAYIEWASENADVMI